MSSDTKPLGKWAMRKLVKSVSSMSYKGGGILFVQFPVSDSNLLQLQSIPNVSVMILVLQYTDAVTLVVSSAPNLPTAWRLLCLSAKELLVDASEDERTRVVSQLRLMASDRATEEAVQLIEPEWF